LPASSSRGCLLPRSGPFAEWLGDRAHGDTGQATWSADGKGTQVKFKTAYFHCGEHLRRTLADPIAEIESAISAVKWRSDFEFTEEGSTYSHQAGYNKALAKEFLKRGWEHQPELRTEPKLIGDFRKGLVFVEVQFGNSSALYRDYYKFQYGLSQGLLSLAVLIVPAEPALFFPGRPESVQNMAEFALARTCFEVLPINVPTLLVGLLPEN
jgi:hypothetical protein